VVDGNNDEASCNELQASYTNVRHWEELIDFIKQNCSPKELHYWTAICQCNFTYEELVEGYMGFFPPGQMMNDHLYGHISYNSSL
jgi:hypothetical protein